MKNPQSVECQSHYLTAQERPQDILEGVFIADESQFIDRAIPSRAYTGVSEEKRGGAATEFTLQIPSTILDPYPLLVVHGYCGPEVVYSKFREAVAASGKIAVTYKPPRNQDMSAAMSREHRLHPERLLAQAALGAMYGSEKLLRKKGHVIDGYDISGHSMGGRSATKVGLLHPEFVRSVVLNEAAGLDGHTIQEFVTKRIPKFVQRELIPALIKGEFAYQSSSEVMLQMTHYLMRNPYKTLAEGLVAGNCNIGAEVRLLGLLGVAASILVAESDTMISGTGTARLNGNSSKLFSVYSDPKANHLWPYTHPLESAMTHEQILTELHAPASAQQADLAIAA